MLIKQLLNDPQFKMIWVILFILIYSCSTLKQTEQPVVKLNGDIGSSSPGSCLITGLILKIIEKKETSDSLSICGKASCNALVKIENVSRCGSAVAFPVNETDTVLVYFVFSLAPTASVNASIHPAYPGLRISDHFEGYLEQRIVLGDKVNYRVYGYTLKK